MKYLVKEALPDGRTSVLGRGLGLTEALVLARKGTWAVTVAEDR